MRATPCARFVLHVSAGEQAVAGVPCSGEEQSQPVVVAPQYQLRPRKAGHLVQLCGSHGEATTVESQRTVICWPPHGGSTSAATAARAVAAGDLSLIRWARSAWAGPR